MRILKGKTAEVVVAVLGGEIAALREKVSLAALGGDRAKRAATLNLRVERPRKGARKAWHITPVIVSVGDTEADIGGNVLAALRTAGMQ